MLCARKLLPPAMTSVPIPNRQTILVADDERVIADTLKLILSQHGFDAAVAYDGNSAIEMARRFSPQLFLCDVIMPVSYTHLTLPTKRIV